MTSGKLFPFDAGSSAAAGFGGVPGHSVFFSNPGPDDTLYSLSEGSLFGTDDASSITAGITDMVTQYTHAAGLSAAGDNLDFGQSMLSSGYVLGVFFSEGDIAHNVGSFSPSCYDAGYSTTSANSGGAAGILLGDRCQAYAGSFQLNSSTGDQSITDPGFTPDLVIFLGCIPYAINGARGGTNFMFGAMDGVGNQWVLCTRSILGSGGSGGGFAVVGNRVLRYSEFHDDACIAHIGAVSFDSPETFDQLASFVSMDSDGFTINLSAAGLDAGGDSMTVTYLAVKANSGEGAYQVGVGTQGDTSLSTGFAPEVVMFGSAQNLDATRTLTCYPSLGAVDASIERNAWQGSESAPAPSTDSPPNYSYFSTASSIRLAAGAGTVVGEANATLTSGGATLNWTTDDSSPRQFGWIAFANSGDDRTAPVVVTGDATALTTTTATVAGTITPNTGATVDSVFDYGTTTSYGSSTTAAAAGSGSSPIAVTANLTGLTPGTTYHYRVKSIDETTLCVIYGDDMTFTTAKIAKIVFRNRVRAEDPPGPPDTGATSTAKITFNNELRVAP